MPKFSKSSRRRLNSAHIDFKILFNAVIKRIDCKVICSYRNENAQNRAYNEGNSPFRFPDSKHNQKPSLAVDVVPWPLDWTNIDSFIELGRIVKEEAEKYKIDVDWGGDWKTLKDYPHWEKRDGL